MSWNILVTAHRYESAQAKRQLEDLSGAPFKRTPFRDVLVGEVADPVKFLGSVSEAMGGNQTAGAPVFIAAFARIVPLEISFSIEPETLLETLKAKLSPFVESIKPGDSFAVRVERRGFKGTLKSHELEKALAEPIYNRLEKESKKKPKVDLEDPDWIIAVELLGNECAVGLIAKDIRRKFPFVRVD